MTSLTDRQLDVLRLLADGLTPWQIYDEWGTSGGDDVHEIVRELRRRGCLNGRLGKPVVSAGVVGAGGTG